MRYRFLGAWSRGELGLESKVCKGGVSSDETFVLCPTINIPLLLNFIHQNWPEVFKGWQKAHPDPLVEDTSYGPDISLTIPSRTGGDAHTIHRIAGRWSCNCVGFSYRGTCWALVYAKDHPGTTLRGQDGQSPTR